jgi:hypothetical protein
MAGPWLANDDVKTAIGRRLGKDPASLEPWADKVAAQANLDATADLTSLMLALGYTIDQLDNWDHIAVYAERLAIWFAFNSPPLRTDNGEAADKPNDPREMLRTLAAIVVDGVAIAPTIGASNVGGVAYGTMAAAADLHDELREDWFR